MGGGERVLVKVLVGHKSSLLEAPTPEGHLFKWTVFVKTVEPMTDRSFINKVAFRLHETFPNPLRTVRDPPFEVSETGHSSFNVALSIHFNYNGAKPIKYAYDMVIVLEKTGYNQQEVILELKDVPPAFMDIIKRHGAFANKKKRDSLGKETLPPKKMKPEEPTKPPTTDYSSSKERERKEKKLKEDKLKKKSKEKDYRDSKDREPKDRDSKDREPKDRDFKDRDRDHVDRDRHSSDHKEREKEKKDRESTKDREPKERKDKLMKEFDFSKVHDKKLSESRSPKPVVREEKKSERDTSKLDNGKEEKRLEVSREDKKLSPNGVSFAVKNNAVKPQVSISPRIENKVRLSDASDLSSPSSSLSSSSLNESSHSLTSSPYRGMSAEEMHRKINSLTSGEQIFKVASILLSHPGTTFVPSKSILSFDLDLASADPFLIQKLCQALSS
ncbi:unnamed protein product [Auanema sp. JU1783]|nr:unnamed protein product [Auanema sp. JU1783]